MKQRLLIKLVTGRMLIDTQELSIPFEIEEGGKGWIMTVANIAPREASYIGDNLDHLNFFYFLTDDDGAVTKFWLYDLDKPGYVYDPAMREAVFEVDARVAYSNERV